MKKLVSVLALLLVAAIVVASVFGVQKNNLAKELEAIKAELATSKTNVDALKAEANAAKAELEKSVAKVAELEAKVTELTAKGDASAAEVAEANAKIEAAKAELATVKAELEAALAALEAATAADADIIIVGAGGAGLSAAIHAAEAGAKKVIVLEMTAKTGGALNFTSGSMSAAGTTIQKEENVEDSIELYVADIINNGDDFGGKPNKELIEVYAKDATEVFEWLYNEGIKDMFKPGAARAVFAPEHALYSVPRTYKPAATDPSYKSAAHQVLDKLVAADSRIEVITETTAKELIANEKGQITGVKAVNSDGEIVTYTSENGVIVCTGGYSSNSKLMGQYAPYGESYLAGGAPGADGYGIYMMQKVGAGITAMDAIPTFPMGLVSKIDETRGSIRYPGTYKAGGIIINKEGNRFTNETHAHPAQHEVMLEQQPDAVQFDIYTDEILADLNATSSGWIFMRYFFYKGGEGEHVMYSANSIEELAETIGVPAENLKKTVETYNANVDKALNAAEGEVVYDEFGRNLSETDKTNNLVVGNKIEGDKYYAIRIHALCVMTLGGVTANENMQVLDEAGNVIPGLYAAGECVGGIWGKFVSGGTGVMGPIVFGRIAARHAMTNEMAEGYVVKEAANILDASLFEKESANADARFDMTKALKDGEYTDAVVGHNGGDLTVKVVIAGGKIADVQVVSHTETAGISDKPIASVPANIMKYNTPDVDTVSGATVTSNAIMDAVAKCLEQASK